MVINNRPSRYPRQGPSCTFVIIILSFIALGFYVIGNAAEVRDAIIPTPTAQPTRSAEEYAVSAVLYQRDGEYEDAIIAYTTAITLEANKVDYYMPLIDLLTLTGDVESAMDWAERAKVLAADNDSVWAAVASAHLANGDRLNETGDPISAELQYQLAINAADTATGINPNNASAHAYKADAISRFGIERLLEAQQIARAAIELEPESIVARRAMANIYEQFGDYDSAIQEYLVALDYNPTATDLRIDLAYLYFFTERRQEAILALQEVIDIDPQSADAFDGLGYFYFVLGQYPRAEENAYQAVLIDPNMTRARAHLGASYFKQFKYDNAIEQLVVATNNYEDVTLTNATYFNMLGLAYYYQGQCALAVPLFELVISDPDVEPNTTQDINAQDGLELCRQTEFGTAP